MEKKQQKQTVREEFAEKFIKMLESDAPLSWTKCWASSGFKPPYNGESGRRYNGINLFMLMFRSIEKGYDDPRWYTFNQVKKMDGCNVRKDEKATPVEFWAVYDTVEKKTINLSDYHRILRENPDRKEDEFRLYAKTAYIFNAAQIDGLQPLPTVEQYEFEPHRLAEEAIHTMSENMEVPLIYGGNEAYYSPSADNIHLPRRASFFSEAEYVGTALHELAHASGSPSRLDRPQVGLRADREGYAKEELVAEICSTFLSAELGIDMPDSVVSNHLAYVSSWIKAIKDDNGVLFHAIKEADRAADYLMEQGRVEELRGKLAIEAQMPKGFQGATYEIWQLKDIPENRPILFSDYAFASLYRLTESRYNKVYEAAAEADTDSLDKIFTKFNIAHPADFTGYSLSKSDVVVINQDGKRTAHYVDTWGFQEIKGFTPPQKQTQTGKRGAAR
jgi:antirestriction protein ArdC